MSLVVVIGAVLAVAAVTVALLHGGHPENGCSHGDHATLSDGERFYSRVDRPAGPDAEDASLEQTPAPPRHVRRRTLRLHLGARSR